MPNIVPHVVKKGKGEGDASPVNHTVETVQHMTVATAEKIWVCGDQETSPLCPGRTTDLHH